MHSCGTVNMLSVHACMTIGHIPPLLAIGLFQGVMLTLMNPHFQALVD